MAQRFLINGIEVLAEPQGNGMWAAVPVDLPGTLLKVLTGKININDFLNPSNLTIVPLDTNPTENEDEECADCDCGCQEEDEDEPVRSKSAKTVREYRKAEGMSKTDMADYLGVSRRTLGRWEDAGKLASEVGV